MEQKIPVELVDSGTGAEVKNTEGPLESERRAWEVRQESHRKAWEARQESKQAKPNKEKQESANELGK